MSTYENDIFDRAAEARPIHGAHRRPRSNAPWFFSFVIVVLLGLVIGWAVKQFVFQDSANVSTPSASPTATVKDVPAISPTPTESATPTPTPEPTPTVTTPPPPPPVDHAASVEVLNGTRIRGLAAKNEGELKAAGFTAVKIGNYATRGEPTASTVYYADDAQKSTADEVAKVLKISAVVKDAQKAGQSAVVVILR